MKRLAILVSGDELLYGLIVDRNADWLARRLLRRGYEPVLVLEVGDDLERYGAALRFAVSAADVVVTTGGLGPTDDDLTRQVVAEVAGAPLERNEEAAEHVKAILERVGVALGRDEMRQALIPAGAEIIPNERGTACGFSLTTKAPDGRAVALFSLSGVPGEARQMYETGVEPRLPAAAPVVWRRLNTMGLSESALQQTVRSLDLPSEIRVAYQAADYIVSATFYGRDATVVDAAFARLVAAVEPRRVVSEGEVTLSEALLAALRLRSRSVACAESFTGGLAADLITDAAGVSRFFRGGTVAYSAEAKIATLGVRPETVESHGVCSERTALEMARGARRLFRADFAVATTGVAGPDDLGPELPAGSAFFAVVGPDDFVRTLRKRIPGGRRDVKLRAARTAVNVLRLAVLDFPTH